MDRCFKFLLSASVFLASFTALSGQNDLPDEQVQVFKNFDARLLDAELLKVNPELPPVDTTTKRQNYEVPARSVKVDYQAPVIRPLAMKREKIDPVYNGYAKLGGGLPNSLFGEAGYSILKDKQFDLNLFAKHHSANNKKLENQRFSNNDFGIKGSYYFDQGFAVNGRIGYSRDYVHYYGYNFDPEFQDTSFSKEDVEQRFSIFDIGASFFNGEQTAGDVNYGASADFYYMDDNYAARENGFDLRLHLTKWFAEKHPLTIRLRTDFNEFRDSIDQSLNNFFLQPSFTFHHDYFRVRIGGNLVSNNDEYQIFPDIEATVPILGSRMTAFLGVEGSVQKNTLRTLSTYNPFLGTRSGLMVKNTEYFDYFGGLKGSFNGFEYLGRVGYKQTQDLALFVPNYAGINRTIVPYDFFVVYDDADIFYISGTINAPLFSGLTVVGNVTSNVYNMDLMESAWHLPTLTLSGTIKYLTLEDKATVRASVFVENGVTYPDPTGLKKRLNGLLDISVGAEYRFSEHFGAFIDVYNLANNKRKRWYNYPTFGLNAIAGFSARF